MGVFDDDKNKNNKTNNKKTNNNTDYIANNDNGKYSQCL